MSEMGEWLARQGLGQYAETFEANDIDLDVARLVTDADLEKLGLSLGHRRRFLKAVAALPPGAATPAASAPAALPGTAAPAAPAPERRQLTVMFCDLANSTALAAELDAEDLQALIGDYQRACAEVIERFEGYVAKYMGDGVLAYFGYPQARADAADRAVHAGLGVARAVAARRSARPLAVRVGIATGEVVVGEQIGVDSSREWSIVGDAPNLAARLQAAAEPGQVLVADATRRLARAPIAWSGPQLLSLKGFADPVPAWRALDESAATAAGESAAAAAAHGARLIGRKGELALLDDRLELVRSGLAQVVLLIGEAGIGKSALARALIERAREADVACRQYVCSPFHQTSELNPFVTQIARDVGVVRAESSEANLARLVTWLDRDGGAAMTDSALFGALLALSSAADDTLADLTPAALRVKTLRSVEAHLLRADLDRPALLLVEDAHWMDPSSGDLVDHLIDRLGEHRILLLVTARPEFDARWTRRPNVTVLTLNRLGPRDAAALAAEIPAAQTLPPDIVAALLERAQGNPLFIEELTRAVVEALGSDGTRTADGERLAKLVHVVPTSLRDLLAERLDRLGPAKETAQAAAVIGQEFDLRLLEAIADDPERRRADVGRLLEAEIVVPCGREDPSAYAFRHALMQEAAYQSLLKSRRREYHRRIAEGLERGVVPELREREPERIAQHYAEAGIADRAIECWHQSGLRAAQRSANIEAIRQLSSALQLVRQQPESPERAVRELSLLVTLGPTLQATGGWDTIKVREVYAAALRLARETGRGADLFPALWGRWLIAHASGEAEIARELLAELAPIAREPPNPDLLLQLHHAAGSTHFNDGRFQQSFAEVEACRAGYDVARHKHQAMQYGGHDPCVCASCVGALVQFIVGRAARAQRWSDDALTLAQRIEHAPSIAHAHAYRAELHQIRGDVETTLRAANAALAIASDKALQHYIAWAKMTRGWALAVQGSTDAGIAEVEEGLAGLRKTGVRYHSPHRLGMRAQAYAAAKRHNEAVDAIDEALEAGRTNGERWHEAELHRLKAAMLDAMPRPDRRASEALLEEAVALAEAQGAHLWECRARIDLARMLARDSRTGAARDVLVPVRNWGDDVDVAERADANALHERLA